MGGKNVQTVYRSVAVGGVGRLADAAGLSSACSSRCWTRPGGEAGPRCTRALVTAVSRFSQRDKGRCVAGVDELLLGDDRCMFGLG